MSVPRFVVTGADAIAGIGSLIVALFYLAYSLLKWRNDGNSD